MISTGRAQHDGDAVVRHGGEAAGIAAVMPVKLGVRGDVGIAHYV
jgi:hypothetical protein